LKHIINDYFGVSLSFDVIKVDFGHPVRKYTSAETASIYKQGSPAGIAQLKKTLGRCLFGVKSCVQITLSEENESSKMNVTTINMKLEYHILILSVSHSY